MTNKEILEKAISKAIDGGWTVDDWVDDDDFEWEIDPPDFEGDTPSMKYGGMGETFWHGIGSLMLDHDFAKALWGLDRLLCDNCHTDIEQSDKECWNCSGTTFVYEAYQNTKDNLPNWQFHLASMVIADDPIQYLGKNI